ncbi:hypothetical protein BATDEDRAFT_35904 [Batrachochytrium dendrobatidis JAM81]|uniref:Uncharacterized protein n=2 Tax=Batrachochytrium dendrobatidis TaxID=109871 RepID=F4PAJ0_BATDJ|nr:uncharacterized protein BATDEDRAFT_35904 [Batrachochytrium dendrobatidis JAM81]EGF77694.1 hypothetical protein BATDEDRAFT_35904 [Batrachochytrium dendrobatidis JAM81]OAJ43324.1 hypothetical protein BDEG_26691 [Batrachochytrium dendrobatidis JEL423]|eukprot:XP_006681714.1 hypothetical protein BATDEDRAFT_35904 [Batrachochytrium dendrobatidis JAM81]
MHDDMTIMALGDAQSYVKPSNNRQPPSPPPSPDLVTFTTSISNETKAPLQSISVIDQDAPITPPSQDTVTTAVLNKRNDTSSSESSGSESSSETDSDSDEDNQPLWKRLQGLETSQDKSISSTSASPSTPFALSSTPSTNRHHAGRSKKRLGSNSTSIHSDTAGSIRNTDVAHNSRLSPHGSSPVEHFQSNLIASKAYLPPHMRPNNRKYKPRSRRRHDRSLSNRDGINQDQSSGKHHSAGSLARETQQAKLARIRQSSTMFNGGSRLPISPLALSAMEQDQAVQRKVCHQEPAKTSKLSTVTKRLSSASLGSSATQLGLSVPNAIQSQLKKLRSLGFPSTPNTALSKTRLKALHFTNQGTTLSKLSHSSLPHLATKDSENADKDGMPNSVQTADPVHVTNVLPHMETPEACITETNKATAVCIQNKPKLNRTTSELPKSRSCSSLTDLTASSHTKPDSSICLSDSSINLPFTIEKTAVNGIIDSTPFNTPSKPSFHEPTSAFSIQFPGEHNAGKSLISPTDPYARTSLDAACYYADNTSTPTSKNASDSIPYHLYGFDPTHTRMNSRRISQSMSSIALVPALTAYNSEKSSIQNKALLGSVGHNRASDIASTTLTSASAPKTFSVPRRLTSIPTDFFLDYTLSDPPSMPTAIVADQPLSNLVDIDSAQQSDIKNNSKQHIACQLVPISREYNSINNSLSTTRVASTTTTVAPQNIRAIPNIASESRPSQTCLDNRTNQHTTTINPARSISNFQSSLVENCDSTFQIRPNKPVSHPTNFFPRSSSLTRHSVSLCKSSDQINSSQVSQSLASDTSLYRTRPRPMSYQDLRAVEFTSEMDQGIAVKHSALQYELTPTFGDSNINHQNHPYDAASQDNIPLHNTSTRPLSQSSFVPPKQPDQHMGLIERLRRIFSLHRKSESPIFSSAPTKRTVRDTILRSHTLGNTGSIDTTDTRKGNRSCLPMLCLHSMPSLHESIASQSDYLRNTLSASQADFNQTDRAIDQTEYNSSGKHYASGILEATGLEKRDLNQFIPDRSHRKLATTRALQNLYMDVCFGSLGLMELASRYEGNQLDGLDDETVLSTVLEAGGYALGAGVNPSTAKQYNYSASMTSTQMFVAGLGEAEPIRYYSQSIKL